MSFLGSLFNILFGWIGSWFSNNDYYSAMTTKSGVATLDGTDDAEKYVVNGSVKSLEEGSNVIDMGKGSDTLSILGSLESENSNQVLLGAGGSSLKVSGSVLATGSGENEIAAGADNDSVNITSKVLAQDDAHNYISLGDGENTVCVTWSVSAEDDASNTIETGKDADCVTISGGLYAEGTNIIDLGDGDNSITIRGGMNANGGTNAIETGNGDDYVSIWGVTQASDGGTNTISTGAGDDTISLHNTIGEGALLIDAGAGDNTLVLNGSRISTFNNAYQDWLENYAEDYGLDEMNVGTFEVTMTRTTGLSDLEWLKDLTDEASINLQLNIDGNGRSLKLSSFYEEGEADVFSILSMEGGTKNTLTISGSLADNGYNGSQLVILGDDTDTVKLGSEWQEVLAQDAQLTFSGDLPNYDFNCYQNVDDNTLLLIHNGINIS